MAGCEVRSDKFELRPDVLGFLARPMHLAKSKKRSSSSRISSSKQQQQQRKERRETREERRDKHDQDKKGDGRMQRFNPKMAGWFGPRRAGWWRKWSGPRREDGRAQGEALTAARKDHARKLKAALLDGLKKEESREKLVATSW